MSYLLKRFPSYKIPMEIPKYSYLNNSWLPKNEFRKKCEKDLRFYRVFGAAVETYWTCGHGTCWFSQFKYVFVKYFLRQKLFVIIVLVSIPKQNAVFSIFYENQILLLWKNAIFFKDKRVCCALKQTFMSITSTNNGSKNMNSKII